MTSPSTSRPRLIRSTGRRVGDTLRAYGPGVAAGVAEPGRGHVRHRCRHVRGPGRVVAAALGTAGAPLTSASSVRPQHDVAASVPEIGSASSAAVRRGRLQPRDRLPLRRQRDRAHPTGPYATPSTLCLSSLMPRHTRPLAPRPTPSPGWVAQTGKIVRIGDTRLDARCAEPPDDTRSVLAVPLRALPEPGRRHTARAPAPERLRLLRRAHPRLTRQPGRDRGRERPPLRGGRQGVCTAGAHHRA
jgi:hypothetical protein